jgi:hypothetical protein
MKAFTIPGLENDGALLNLTVPKIKTDGKKDQNCSTVQPAPILPGHPQAAKDQTS